MVHTVQLREGLAEVIHCGGVDEAKVVCNLCGGSLARDQHLLVEILIKHLQGRMSHHHLVLMYL